MKKYLFLFLIFLTSCSSENMITGGTVMTPPIISDSEEVIKIATFNIQIFGKTKSEKNDVMEILAKTARNFDIIAVQEFRDKTEETPGLFLEKINSDIKNYDYILSPRLGRTSSKENYAFYYDTDKISYIHSYTYEDPDDYFEREPFLARFKSGTFDFVLINIHTRPDSAINEIEELDTVVTDAKTKFREEDFIVLGDFNADCSYFSKDTYTSLQDEKYYWIVPDETDTTVKSSDCAYDRIVFIKESTFDDYANNWDVFRFDEEYNLTQEFTEKVSDHYPIYAEFYTNKDSD